MPKKTFGAGAFLLRFNPFLNVLETLIVRKNKNPSIFGVPGGKKNPDEDATHLTFCAIRETFEETGYVIRTHTSKNDHWEAKTYSSSIFQDTDINNFCFRVFRATIIAGSLKPSDEGEVYWGDPLDLLQGPYIDYNTKMLKNFSLIGHNQYQNNDLSKYPYLSKYDGV